MSSSSHQYYNSYSSAKQSFIGPQSTLSGTGGAQIPTPAVSDVGNDLLAPSPNFLNE